MGWNGLCLLAVALLVQQAAEAACPALTINFFPDGSKNVPAGWTRDAQVAAGNEDSSSLNTIKLTAVPHPHLFVQPMHPLFSKKACVPSDCLPAPAKGLRRLAQQDDDSSSNSSSSGGSGSSSSSGSGSSSSSGSGSSSSSGGSKQGDSWDPVIGYAGTRYASTEEAEEEAGAERDSSRSSSASSNSSSIDLQNAAPIFETGTAGAEEAFSSNNLAGSDGSSRQSIKDSIAAGGGGSSGGRSSSSGWTTWHDPDDWWDASNGESRQLATCLTTVAVPAAYEVMYNIDGGVTKKATMPKEGAPFIALTNLDTLAPGKHTLNIKITMLKGTAEVNSVATMQPPADQVYTTKVVFNLVEGKGEQPAAEAVEASHGAAAGATPANATAKPAGNATAAAPAPAADAKKNETTEGEGAAAEPKKDAAAEKKEGEPAEGPKFKKNITDIMPEAPSVDATVAQQAVKYFCMRQYNVGGKIHSQKNVTAGDEGVNQCAVACNALGQDCSGFGVTADKCFLMKAFNTSSSAADSTLDALCMKNANDWLDFGMQGAGGKVGSNFFCLRGYDMKGDPAGSGDLENPMQSANTEIAGMIPSTCATQCKSTAGCQFMLIKKPSISGGTSTCFLKMHALGGLYGNTGPAKDVDLACFNGQEAWMTFGGQLDFALPSPEVNTGVQTPALAAVTPTGAGAGAGNGTAKTYRCIKGYLVNGTVGSTVQVSLGDEGLTQCAAKCDSESSCVGYSMTDAGACSLLKDVNFNTSGPSPKTYGMCFGNPAEWNKFGNPDGSGMFCVKNYDFAGDGVRTLDYITITSGAGAVQFCKQQCSAEPQCQFSVTSLGKCYLKNNILSGSFGTTRADTAVDAACVKGESNWALAALQVSATPAAPVAGRAGGNLTARRSVGSKNSRSAAASAQPGLMLLLLSVICAAVLGSCFSQQ